jgi:hypothetical protein
MNAATRIKFVNILELARYAALSGTPQGLLRAEEHLAEARTLVAFERRLLDDQVAS